MAINVGVIVALTLLVLTLVVAVMSTGIKVIRPWEAGVYMRLGRFAGILQPGLNIVPPLISEVVRVDLRERRVDFWAVDVTTKDRSRFTLTGRITFRVVDPKAALFQVDNYSRAIELEAKALVNDKASVLTGDELLTMLESVRDSVRQGTADRARSFGVFVQGVVLDEPKRESPASPSPWTRLRSPS